MEWWPNYDNPGILYSLQIPASWSSGGFFCQLHWWWWHIGSGSGQIDHHWPVWERIPHTERGQEEIWSGAGTLSLTRHVQSTITAEIVYNWLFGSSSTTSKGNISSVNCFCGHTKISHDYDCTQLICIYLLAACRKKSSLWLDVWHH